MPTDDHAADLAAARAFSRELAEPLALAGEVLSHLAERKKGKRMKDQTGMHEAANVAWLKFKREYAADLPDTEGLLRNTFLLGFLAGVGFGADYTTEEATKTIRRVLSGES